MLLCKKHIVQSDWVSHRQREKREERREKRVIHSSLHLLFGFPLFNTKREIK
jgi:hypothetical protein